MGSENKVQLAVAAGKLVEQYRERILEFLGGIPAGTMQPKQQTQH